MIVACDEHSTNIGGVAASLVMLELMVGCVGYRSCWQWGTNEFVEEVGLQCSWTGGNEAPEGRRASGDGKEGMKSKEGMKEKPLLSLSSAPHAEGGSDPASGPAIYMYKVCSQASAIRSSSLQLPALACLSIH